MPEPKVTNSLNARARSALRTRAALISSGRRALGSGLATGIGIADLARDAGVATGSFYNHFGSKAELFAATLTEVVEELAQLLDNAAAGVDDPVDVVRAHVRALGAVGRVQPDIAAIVDCFLRRATWASLRLPRGHCGDEHIRLASHRHHLHLAASPATRR
ncbi:TetR/AcrR family transcriptional regulator [Nocardia sp. NPDC047654]|uniref:TetR/AcrR family transcriptional regulator n=1 Tax=Nocardia sp. NPDC047654 TaxID=3364314 RepID=UPI00371BFDC0